MNNYCAFSKDHQCLKWTDYQIARYELEEADELCHGLQLQIEHLEKQVQLLERHLTENGIPIPESEYDW